MSYNKIRGQHPCPESLQNRIESHRIASNWTELSMRMSSILHCQYNSNHRHISIQANLPTAVGAGVAAAIVSCISHFMCFIGVLLLSKEWSWDLVWLGLEVEPEKSMSNWTSHKGYQFSVNTKLKFNKVFSLKL